MRPPLLYAAGLLLSTRVVAAASSSDSQRCYFAASQLAPDYIIPCYSNWSDENFACCKKGNKCLDGNACYDDGTGVTYQYGCTDRDYKDKNCPHKCGLDTNKSNWVGLVYCNGSDNTPNNTWICHHPENCGDEQHCPGTTPWDSKLQKMPALECSDMENGQDFVAVLAGPVLPDQFRLPGDDRGVSSYLSVHSTTKLAASSPTPSSTGTPSSGSTTGSAATAGAHPTDNNGPSTTSPTRTASATASDTAAPAPATYSKGMYIGLPVGLVAGALVLVGMFFYYRHHRKEKHRQARDADRFSGPNSYEPFNDDKVESYGHVGVLPPDTPEALSMPVFELPASSSSPTPHPNACLRPISEIHGSPVARDYNSPMSGTYSRPISEMHGSPVPENQGSPPRQSFGSPTSEIHGSPVPESDRATIPSNLTSPATGNQVSPVSGSHGLPVSGHDGSTLSGPVIDTHQDPTSEVPGSLVAETHDSPLISMDGSPVPDVQQDATSEMHASLATEMQGSPIPEDHESAVPGASDRPATHEHPAILVPGYKGEAVPEAQGSPRRPGSEM
ncbi:hypothetical protein BCR34DRAFT_607478 [Clohesyomyces aquaticus]|uniref:Uncharacterized protein n=1 Tax=Clohesyomyces aquaticus TaxID=1231657 RepID=A0A1Y1YFT6_9PLEO|nr:hypothetical protein BCR34DRAFT_607478 [Clohesyomyces aquaticus]